MRHTGRNDDDIALDELPRVACVDRDATQFIGARRLCVDRAAARDERGLALEHVDHVGVQRVNLGLTRRDAAAGVDHVVAAVGTVEQDRSSRKCLVHRLMIEEGDRRRGCRRSSERGGSGNGELLVFVGACRSADTDAADDLAIHHDGNAADEWGEVVESGHHGAAFAAGVDELLEHSRRLLEQHGGFCFSDGDVGAGGEGAVESGQGHQVAAVIDDGNDRARGLQTRGLRLRCGDHLIGSVKRERLLLKRLATGGGECAEAQRENGSIHRCVTCFHFQPQTRKENQGVRLSRPLRRVNRLPCACMGAEADRKVSGWKENSEPSSLRRHRKVPESVSGEFNLDSGEVRCADVRQRLSEYLDGDLDTATAALAITHLDTCSACTAVLEGMKNVIILLGDLAEFELPEELRHAGLDSVNRWRRIDN